MVFSGYDDPQGAVILSALARFRNLQEREAGCVDL